MTWRLADLPWLPRPPADFRDRCHALDESAGPRGAALAGLAAFALDEPGLARLARGVARARAAGAGLAPLSPFRLGILSNATTDLLVPALIGSGLRHGVALEVVAAPFDQGMQAALDPSSPVQRARPDAVLLAFDHRLIAPPAASDDAAAAEAAVAAAFEQVMAMREGVRSGCGAAVIAQTVPAPLAALLGSFDARLPGSRRSLAAAFNARLAAALAGSPDVLLDTAALAHAAGLAAWHDDAQWHLAKLPFSQSLVPLYADHVGRLLGALRGRSRKCLVLDLDNTLWGGVIGDDGIDGIMLGPGDAAGEAYLAVQRMALELRDHGILLAVSSKNDEAIAREPFRGHPDMLLAEDDIAVFQANWQDKAGNLEAIANALDIGLDALVLVDDNPAERALVREMLPAVAVPELPAEPALIPRTVLAAGYFEAVAFSGEDRARAADYRANAGRRRLRAKARDLSAYLASLEMTITFAPFDARGRARIAQLVNKSNQFNLTTRRYTEAEIAAVEADPGAFTLQARLRDRFADAGMISVVICRQRDNTWEIDTWLMSCRVLGRRVEEAVLAEIVRWAEAAGVERLVGRYIPTARNGLVKDHYARLGFVADGADGDATLWRLDVAGFAAPALPMTVDRRAPEKVA